MRVIDLHTWAPISDYDLLEAVLEIFISSHPGIGRRFIEARLFSKGLRVQRERIEWAMLKLEIMREPSKRIRRCEYNENPGYMWCSHLDQNENLKKYRISLLSVIDGYTRSAPHWSVVSDLTGETHTQFFLQFLEKHKWVPEHVSIDGTECWNALSLIMRTIWANDLAPAVFFVNDVILRIYRVHYVNSFHNTPVERSWDWCNLITTEYKKCFEHLELRGVLLCGRRPSHLDLFCLHAVFLPQIKLDLEEHFIALLYRKKEKCTKNPLFPDGTHRPIQLLRTANIYGRPLSDTELTAIRQLGESYPWSSARTGRSPSIGDPLQSAVKRQTRFTLMQLHFPPNQRPRLRDFEYLSNMYIAYRFYTTELL